MHQLRYLLLSLIDVGISAGAGQGLIGRDIRTDVWLEEDLSLFLPLEAWERNSPGFFRTGIERAETGDLPSEGLTSEPPTISCFALGIRWNTPYCSSVSWILMYQVVH